MVACECWRPYYRSPRINYVTSFSLCQRALKLPHLWAFNFAYLMGGTSPVISRLGDPSIFLLVVDRGASVPAAA